MSAKLLHIKDRDRQHMGIITSLADFTWVEGETTDAKSIANNPNISLYCLDDKRQEAIFAVLPEDIDLSHVPFVYQAQFDHAEYLIAVPYSTFLQLADDMTVDASRLVCIHNIGRCGSTLLSQAFNEVDDVVALSEPDVFTNFVTIRHTPREEQIRLLQASYKFMFRPAVVGDKSLHVLKLRNQCVDIMDIFAEVLPNATHLFMYRNAIDWLSSFHRLRVKHSVPPPKFTREESIKQMASYYNRAIRDVEPFFDPSIETYHGLVDRGVGWLVMMVRYMDVHQTNGEFLAMRYEDLMEQRDETLSAIFERVGLPVSAIEQAQKAFTRDSQAGTKLARDNAQSGNTIQLPDEEIEAVLRILSQHPIINRPDIILQGTISV
jgi:hypothetical protein